MMETLATSPGFNVALPEYTVSRPPPDYSSSPLAQEQSLSYSFSNSRHYSLPTGTFTKTKKGVLTIALTEQEDNVVVPFYDGLTPVRGLIAMEHPECISKVEVKLTGQLETTFTCAGTLTGYRTVAKKATFLVGSMTLWEASPAENVPPSSIPFTFPFPKTFRDENGSEYPLPPSHSYQCLQSIGIISKVKYSLTVVLQGRGSHNAISSLFKLNTKCLKVRLTYIPRHRPFLPILAHSDLLGTVKTCPEEWYQSLCNIPKRHPPKAKHESEDFGDIDVNIFIPAVQIFGLRDSIPFHIQISGSSPALRSLWDPGVTTQTACKEDQLQVKVAIHRSFCLSAEGIKAVRTFTIGEGTVSSLPPTVDLDSDDLPKNPTSCQLDYEGNVRISRDLDSAKFGGFHAGRISVADFVVVSIVPSPGHPYRSRWFPLQKAIPVRFVTDSWGDGVSINGLV